jgi:hypothetical protein
MLNAGQIANVNAANTAIVTANSAVVSYVNTLNSAMVANIVNVANDHNNLNGALNNINFLFGNVGNLASQINTVTFGLTGANAAIVTANSAVVSYVNTLNSARVSDITSITNTLNGIPAIITAGNTASRSYADALNAAMLANVTAANTAIGTWTVSQVGVINSVAATNANVTAANVNIATALQSNILMKVYVDTAISTVSNNITAANAVVSTLSTTVNTNSSSITAANASIVGLRANITAANSAIATNTSTISTINGTLNTLIANINSASVTVTGNVVARNVYASSYYFANGSPFIAGGNIGLLTFVGNSMSSSGGNLVLGTNGVYLNAQGSNKIHLNTYTGIRNPNPGALLGVGDGAPGAVYNTGNIDIGFSNGSGLNPYRGDVTFDWDWYDGVIGTNSTGGPHARFGLYKQDDGGDYFAQPFMVFDYNTGNVTLGNVTTTGALNVNKLAVDTLTANTVTSSGTGIPTISSTTNVNLSAENAVVVTQSVFRLANFTQAAVANLTPQAGDMVYNTTYANIQIYTGTRWGNLTVS